MRDRFLPLVSIMVPVYNIEPFVAKSILSLLNQTYENIEIVIVNDCSTDNSQNIVQSIIDNNQTKKRIKFISHNKNLGLGGARLTALDNASGDWYMFVDGDDYLDSNAVEILVKHAQKYKADLVVFDYRVVYDNRIRDISCSYIDKESYIKNLLLKTESASVWNKFYSASLFKDNQILPEIGLNQGEDYAMTPRLAYCAKSIIKLDECLYNYVKLNDESYTKNFKVEHILQLKRADDILNEFFANKVDREVLALMRIRTLLYMYKITSANTINIISKFYNFPLRRDKLLSRQDNLLICLINKRFLKGVLMINTLRNYYLKYFH